jgi:hypothetical protein
MHALCTLARTCPRSDISRYGQISAHDGDDDDDDDDDGDDDDDDNEYVWRHSVHMQTHMHMYIYTHTDICVCMFVSADCRVEAACKQSRNEGQYPHININPIKHMKHFDNHIHHDAI